MNTATKMLMLLDRGLSPAAIAIALTRNTFGASLFAYYPLLGDVLDYSGNGYTATNNGANLTGATFRDGTPCALFNGTSAYIQLPQASLDTPFDGAEGTIALWLQFASAALTDGAAHIIMALGADVSNRRLLYKTATNNQVQFLENDGGTLKTVNATINNTSWHHIALTWKKAVDDRIVTYVDGVAGTPATGLGTFAGALASGFCQIGAQGGGTVWSGNAAHVAIGNRALSAAEIAVLAA